MGTAIIPNLDSIGEFRIITNSADAGTIDGPIKRDRLFFFADYQVQRQAAGGSCGERAVPSSAGRGGDISPLASDSTIPFKPWTISRL
ncbi:MAG: hypothetical protein ACLQVL_34080 [Terriglobia bacterium]